MAGAQGATTVVPDVVGFNAADACAMVHAAGLIAYGPDLTPAPTSGVIIAQEPDPDSPAAPTDPVLLWPQESGHTADDLTPDPAGMAIPGT